MAVRRFERLELSVIITDYVSNVKFVMNTEYLKYTSSHVVNIDRNKFDLNTFIFNRNTSKGKNMV